MRTTSTAILLLLLAVPFAGRAARSQEPPPYQGNDAAQGGDAQPQDNGQAPAGDPAVAGVEYFHDQLSPYGQWVERDGYGYVWVPQVATGWRPYTTGHWIYTDQGWAWVADEPWGWAAFHYGRWYYDGDIGWAWVPGTVWAPAWVAWRHGGGYLGWAPLGPSVGFAFGAGLDFRGVAISTGFFTFVGERDILAPRVSTVILSTSRNVTIVQNTTNITNYTVVNGRVINAGVSAARISQVTGRVVQPVAVASLSGGVHGKGAFFQPAVVTRAASVSHAEFGKSLSTQVATQQRSRTFTRAAAAGTSTSGGKRPVSGTASSSHSGQFGVGIDSKGQGGTGTSGSKGPGGSTGSTGASGNKGSGPSGSTSSTGTYGSKGPSGSTASAGTGSKGATGTQGQTHGNPPTGQAAAQGTQPKKTPPPPKEKEKEKKPPV